MSCRPSSSALRVLSSANKCIRSFHSGSIVSEEAIYNPWQYKRHLKGRPTVPTPLPRIYPQQVVLSDGSTFTSYTTAPSPAILRLTRDVTNNPLWAPGSEKRGLAEEEGRVGRFRKKFESMDFMGSSTPEDQSAGVDGEVVDDLSWMSEGGKEEAAPKVKLIKKPAKGGKKK